MKTFYFFFGYTLETFTAQSLGITRLMASFIIIWVHIRCLTWH